MIKVVEIPYAWVKKELTFDGPYQKGAKGPKVRLIQEWVSLQKEPPQQVGIDGDFGPATERVVRLFQKAKGLPETGIVDETTFLKLIEPMLQVLTPLPAAASFPEMVVNYAKQHLQFHPLEIGGENCGPWVRLYMHGKQGADWKWCAGFVFFLMQQAADTLGRPLPRPQTFLCNELASEAKRKGIFVSEADLDPGDPPPGGSIFLCRNPKNSAHWFHTGLVTEFDDETFETIEGNTDNAGSSNGYEACRRCRRYADKDFVKLT